MSEPFLAEIRIFAGNFAPKGWAFCDGQLLPIAQNTAVFSLVGTTYGGDGRTTFALPDLRGSAPMHPGTGPGLTARILGEKGGVTSVTLTEAQIPQHTHTLRAVNTPFGQVQAPTVNTSFARSNNGNAYASVSNLVNLSAQAVPNVGGGQPHTNVQPYLTMSFIIALAGIYPSRP